MNINRRGLLKLSAGLGGGGIFLSAAKVLGVAPKATTPPLD